MNLENFMDKKIKDAPKMVKESPGKFSQKKTTW